MGPNARDRKSKALYLPGSSTESGLTGSPAALGAATAMEAGAAVITVASIAGVRPGDRHRDLPFL